MRTLLLTICLALLGVGTSARKAHRLPPRDLARPDRIVGGEPVLRGELPWQVSIQQKIGHKYAHFCGGTLIANSWVVTAAHCTIDIDYSRVVVVTGAWDLMEDNNEFKVEKVIRGEYDELTLKHDIALLKLDSKQPLNTREGSTAVPLSLETRKEFGPGMDCIISGWGRMKDGASTLPNVLMAADVTLRSDDECNSMFARHSFYSVHDTNICAGGEDRDACQGDSGGPLACCVKGSNDPADCRLAGITSWGIGCATKDLPGVYTEVAHYIKWIQEVIEEEGGNSSVEKIALYAGGDEVEEEEEEADSESNSLESDEEE